MHRHAAYTSALYSLDTPGCEFQIVATCDHLVLDVQARAITTDGHMQAQYALADLSVADARRLRDLLDKALIATGRVVDPRQTSLWSNSSLVAVAGEMQREQSV